MITNSIEKVLTAKKEGNTIEGKISKNSSSSRHWSSGLDDPRVVRVSRSFGGKDRHSKVCTVRGLRDRRVRLSVPTAIQLYDLQDRLGLNQPSKVVDWLLNAAKNDIDELPPLQIPPGNFGHHQFSPHLSVLVSHEDEVNGLQSSLASFVDGKIDYVKDDGSSTTSTKQVFKINDNVSGGKYQAPLRSKCKEVAQESGKEESNWMERNEQENHGIEVDNARVSFHNPLPPRSSDSSFTSLLNSLMPYNPYYQYWGHSNFPLSSLGSNIGYSIRTEDPHNYNVVSMPSAIPTSFFSPYFTAQVERNPRQINHLQMLSSTSQNLLSNSLNLTNPPMRPLQLGITPNPRVLHYQNNNNGSQSNKGSGPSSAFASTSFNG